MIDLIEVIEHAAIRASLVAAVDGPFLPDWEFETLVGSSREEVRELAVGWPSNAHRESLEVAASVLTNLIGYPHGEEQKLAAMVGVPVKELSRILAKLNQLVQSMDSTDRAG